VACQSILELRSEGQEICYTRNSYTEIGGEICGGEVGKEDYGKMGGMQDSSSSGHTNLLTNGLCGLAVCPKRHNRIVPPADKPSNCASRYKPLYSHFVYLIPFTLCWDHVLLLPLPLPEALRSLAK
jgi:hypothetical protein